MTNATLRANARPLPIDRRLFIASGTAAAVFGALSAAAARAAVAPDAAATAFDPAAYVAVWERCGNAVFWDVTSSGRESFALHFPDDATFPDFAELCMFDSALGNGQDANRRLVAYLKTRGQEAGRPFSVGGGPIGQDSR